MVSLGGGDIHEMAQVVARGIYPRCEEDLHKDPEEGFKLVFLIIVYLYFLNFQSVNPLFEIGDLKTISMKIVMRARRDATMSFVAASS